MPDPTDTDEPGRPVRYGWMKAMYGTVVAITYGHWTPGAAPYIIGVRFSLGQLDRIRQTSSNG